MKFLFLGNNLLGLNVLNWLISQGEIPKGVVVPSPPKARMIEDIIQVARDHDIEVFDGSLLDTPEVLNRIRSLGCTLAVSVLFAHILRRNFIELFPDGCVNLHPSYLPYNRGNNPNVWSIVDETPAGVTLHYIDEGVDSGDIIAQKEVVIEPWDTGKTLYHKLENAALELFVQTWPRLREGRVSRRPQNLNVGSCHLFRELQNIDHIDLDRCYRARDLINILRARTFPPYPGAFFLHNGKKIYMYLEFKKEADFE